MIVVFLVLVPGTEADNIVTELVVPGRNFNVCKRQTPRSAPCLYRSTPQERFLHSKTRCFPKKPISLLSKHHLGI